MRALLSQLPRGGWLLALTVLVLPLLAACAGSSTSSDAPSAPLVRANGALAADDDGEAVREAQDAQPTPEPLAARVNGEPILLSAYMRERERRTLGLEIQPATEAAFNAQVLQAMIDQVLINQAAAAEGIVVSEAEIEAELTIQSDLAAQTGTTLEEIVNAQLYTMDEYRTVIRELLTVQKLSEVVANVSPYAEQVHSRHILVADEATAQDLLAQVQAGADFAALAAQYSLDASTARLGGDLDWVSRGDLLQPEVEMAIFSLQPGEIAPYPVKSSLGYHIVQTLERVEDRPLSQAALAEKRQQAFLAWLEGQRRMAVIEVFIDVPIE